MNTNPYPAGRWTSPECRPTKVRRGLRIPSASLAALRDARLRELFWAAEDSSIVEDARLRIEATLASALAAVPAELLPVAPELALTPETSSLASAATPELQAA